MKGGAQGRGEGQKRRMARSRCERERVAEGGRGESECGEEKEGGSERKGRGESRAGARSEVCVCV